MVGNIEQNSKTFVYKHLKLVTDWIKYIQLFNNIIFVILRKNEFHICLEILASFYIPKEHVHLKPIKSDVHDKCDNV